MPWEAKELLTAKLRDCVSIAARRPCFLGFLDESETAFCEDFLGREKDIDWMLWGGYEEAERKIAGFFPDYLVPCPEAFPLEPLTFTWRKEDCLSHRDFLGSFMALGVERSVIGDILVGENRGVVFLRKEMTEYFCENLRKIGRVGVKVTKGMEEPLPGERKFLEISGVVASERLDCLVGLMCRTSREKASELIVSGAVMLNHREILSVSHHVSEGDIVSIRKHGKFMIDQLGPLTSKGRLSVKCRKYQ